VYRSGLLWGGELYFDSTKVKANADIKGMIETAEFEAHHSLNQVFEQFIMEHPLKSA
jgi:hypothetical protein